VLLTTIAAALVTLLSSALLIVALLAYRRGREKGMVFLAAAFALFAVKGALLTASVLLGVPALADAATLLALLDVGVLALLYAVTLRR